MELAINNADIIQYNNITDYNDYLIKNGKNDMSIIDYLKDINERFYNIDISFMESFMGLVDRDDFCIPHEYLITYKVAAPGTCSKDIKKMLKARGLIEGEDYRVGQVSEPVPQGGFVKKNVCMLTPDAFKRCLQGSAITKVYSNYFLFTEKAIKYFFQYQMKIKDLKISSLSDDLKELIKVNKEIKNELKDNNNELKNTNKKLDISNRCIKKQTKTIEEQNTKIEELTNTIEQNTQELQSVKDTLYIKSHERATKVSKPLLNDVFILMR